MTAGKMDAGCFQRSDCPVETLLLQNGIGLPFWGDVICRRKMTEDSVKLKSRQTGYLLDLFGGVLILPDDKPDSAHAGIQFDVAVNVTPAATAARLRSPAYWLE